MSVGVGTNYYSAFNPLNLGDCALWLDAADTSTLTLSGSNVTQWNDKSGNGRNTSAVTGTPVLSNNVVNSKRGVYFNGSSYFTGNFSYSSNTLTWFIVGTMESGTSSFGRLLSFGNSGVLDYDNVARINACSRFDVTNELVSYRNAYVMRNAFVTYGYPFVFSGGIDGTSNSPFLNATAVTGAATSGNFGFAQYSIANGTGTTGGLSTGHIFEIIVYTSVLSTAQRQQIEGYLTDKWNLRVVLPGIQRGILPTNIYGLQLWLDGTDSTTMTLSGSNVTQWNDKSGNGRNTAAVYGTPQLKTDGGFNGLSAVYFGASSAFTGPITNSTSTLSVFVVARLNDIANPRRFLTLGASGRLDYDNASDIAALTTGNSTSELTFYRNYGASFQTAIVTPVYNAPFVYSLQLGNGTGRIYRDFTTTASVANSGVFGYTTYAVAAGFTPTIGNYLGNGYIAEILVYNTLLSENERQDLNNYFATKYARTYTPPLAHIYKSITPVTRSFAPIDIPGCALWLDAADPGSITLSGSNVTQWNDKSGGGWNATAQTGNATYSSNGVVFTGAQMLQTSLSAVMSNQSFFCVASSGSNFSNMGIVSVFSSNLATGYNYTLASNQQLVSRYDGTSIMTGSTFTQGTTFLYDATVTSGGSSFLYAYGAQVASNLTTPAISGSNATVSIGAYYYPTVDPGPRGNFTGTINEIMLFSNILTTTQRQQIEGYLARKWGLIGLSGQSISTFNPTYISNCSLWLDAADSTTLSQPSTTVSATLNQFVTTTDQTVTYTGTIPSLNVFTDGSSYMWGNYINPPTGKAGTLIHSGSNGVWYSGCLDQVTYFKAVKLQFTLTGSTLTVKGLSAGYTNIASNYLSISNTGGTNDSLFAAYTSVPLATNSNIDGYGVASFTINASIGSRINQWRDKSSNGLILSSTGVSQPTFGPTLNSLQTVQFILPQSLSSTTNLVTNPAQSWFLVFNAYNNSNNTRFWLRHAAGDINVTGGEYFFGGNGTMWANRKSGNVNLERAFIDSVGLSTTPFNSAQWYITDVVDSNTTTDITSYLFRMNGSNRTISIFSTSSNILTGNSSSPVIINSNGPSANVYIAEIVFYNSALTITQVQQIEGYLANKWGLRSSLPSTHPYALRGLPSTHPFISRLPATTVFNPRQISGCTVWLDAADPSTLTLSGSNITQWRDKSGNGTNASQATVSNQPIYQSNSMNGLPSIQFNAISRNNLVCFDTPAFDFGTSARTAFFVIINNYVSGTVASSPHWFWPKTGNGTNALSLVGWISATVQGQAGGASTTFNRNQIFLLGYRFGSTSAFEELFSNSTSVATATKTTGGSSYANATSGYRIGGLDNLDTGSSTYWFDGNIGEILLFNRALSTFERQQVEGYLAWKWGLNGGYSPSITPFTPTSVTGCALWLDATDSTSFTFSSGSNISQWRDKVSGLVGSGVNSPTLVSSSLNGFASVNFNGTNQYVDFGNIVNLGTSQIYIFVVSQYNSTASGTLVGKTSYRGLAGRWGITRDTGSGGMFMLADATGSGVVAAFADTSTSARLLTGYWDRSNLYILQNGTQQATAVLSSAANLSTTDPLYVGAYPNSTGTGPQAGFYFPGKIGEILVYLGSLTTFQRQQVEGYLALKWGLQSSLPSTHPYANRSLPSSHPYKLIKP